MEDVKVTMIAISQHKNLAAAERSKKKNPGSVIVYEKETLFTNERWLVVKPK